MYIRLEASGGTSTCDRSIATADARGCVASGSVVELLFGTLDRRNAETRVLLVGTMILSWTKKILQERHREILAISYGEKHRNRFLVLFRSSKLHYCVFKIDGA